MLNTMLNPAHSRMHSSVFLAVGALSLGASVASAGLATLSASMTVDNSFVAYISTDVATSGDSFLSGNSWPAIDSGSFTFTEAGTYYLHINAVDSGRPAMFIGQFALSGVDASFANGTQALSTNASTGDWTASLVGPGGNDVAVSDLGPNGTSPWGNFASLGDARFIWAEGSPSPLNVWFTTAITVVPAPASIVMIGSFGLVALRRNR